MPALDEIRQEHASEADVAGPQSRGVRFFVGGLALLALIGTLLALRAVSSDPPQRSSASGANERSTTEPGGVGSLWTRPSEGTCDCHERDFETFRELTAESDLVVIGEVGESRIADVMDQDSEYPTRTIHTTVAVDEMLKGSTVSGGVVVSTQELAFGGPGLEDWRVPGHRVLLFLTPSQETSGVYVPSNLAYFQTAYFTTGEEIEITMPSGSDVTGLSHRIAAMTLSELRDRVEAIKV
jgi:hypothetical protein